MALPDEVKAQALREIESFLARKVPPDLADELKFDVSVRGNDVTIIERRPPWNPDFGSEWTASDIARLRYDPSTKTWTLHYPTSSGRWYDYEGLGPARDLRALLTEIEADPTGIFWG
jgi:hypothetical protein